MSQQVSQFHRNIPRSEAPSNLMLSTSSHSDPERSADRPKNINVQARHDQRWKKMRQNSAAKLCARDRDRLVRPQDQGRDDTPRPPQRKRREQGVAGPAPAERSGKANTQPRIVQATAATATRPGRVFIHSVRTIGLSLCSEVHPFRIREAQHQSPSEEVVRECYCDLIITRFQR